MVLNPTNYLTSQGWNGPGNGFTSTSRSKPITVIQKKNLFGIGKDRDTSFPWWDDVFTNIAHKIADGPQRNHSNLNPDLPSSSSQEKPEIKNNLNLEVIKSAQQTAIRRDLYRRFLRGATIIGTVNDNNNNEKNDTPNLQTEKEEEINSNSNSMSKEEKKKRRRIKSDCSESNKKSKSNLQITFSKSTDTLINLSNQSETEDRVKSEKEKPILDLPILEEKKKEKKKKKKKEKCVKEPSKEPEEPTTLTTTTTTKNKSKKKTSKSSYRKNSKNHDSYQSSQKMKIDNCSGLISINKKSVDDNLNSNKLEKKKS